MNMVKEGIQTRRRKQKNTNGNPSAKSKHNKLPPPAKEPQGIFGELYTQHAHLRHHTYQSPFDQQERFLSQQQMDMKTNGCDNESCTRKLITSTLLNPVTSTINTMTNNEVQHVNVMTTNNNNNQP